MTSVVAWHFAFLVTVLGAACSTKPQAPGAAKGVCSDAAVQIDAEAEPVEAELVGAELVEAELVEAEPSPSACAGAASDERNSVADARQAR